jgi:2-polyprenyl-3-methyl-5-hydroxy-6-metoxy-1,4-benzoquinol methylase
LASEEKN